MTDTEREPLAGVPYPPTPLTESFDQTGEWEHGERSFHTVETPAGPLAIRLTERSDDGPLLVRVAEGETGSSHAECIWTGVYWARAYGVPGVHRELIAQGSTRYRLGALYRYAGFPLTERESNYAAYGERPYTPDDEN